MVFGPRQGCGRGEESESSGRTIIITASVFLHGRRDRAQPPQSPQNHGDVTSKDSIVGVRFVHHHVSQSGQQALVGFPRWQHGRVERVRVGQDHIERADASPSRVRCVSVQGRRTYALRQITVTRQQGQQLGQLILGQRLGGEE